MNIIFMIIRFNRGIRGGVGVLWKAKRAWNESAKKLLPPSPRFNMCGKCLAVTFRMSDPSSPSPGYVGDNTLIMEFHFLSTFQPEKGHSPLRGSVSDYHPLTVHRTNWVHNALKWCLSRRLGGWSLDGDNLAVPLGNHWLEVIIIKRGFLENFSWKSTGRGSSEDSLNYLRKKEELWKPIQKQIEKQ